MEHRAPSDSVDCSRHNLSQTYYHQPPLKPHPTPPSFALFGNGFAHQSQAHRYFWAESCSLSLRSIWLISLLSTPSHDDAVTSCSQSGNVPIGQAFHLERLSRFTAHDCGDTSPLWIRSGNAATLNFSAIFLHPMTVTGRVKGAVLV